MKKFIFFAACAVIAAAVSSCNPISNDPPASQSAVTTAKDNLVLHIGFEPTIDKLPAGISEGEAFGEGSLLGDGFYGFGYSNKSGDNTKQAYMSYKLAPGNPFTSLESMTITCWVKLPAGKPAKGALLSFNGTGVEAVWPSFVYLFDNSGVNADTGQEEQDFNGRIDFLAVEGKPAMWPNVRSAEYARKDTWFQIARTYNAADGKWANFVNGVIVNEGEFLPDGKVAGGIKAAFASDCDRLYIGGWASKIEGKAADEWLNYFPGAIDELRVFNKALSEAEVLSLYKEELKVSLEAKK